MGATLNPWIRYLKIFKKPANRGAQIQGTNSTWWQFSLRWLLNINGSSVWKLLHVTFLGPRILSWLLDFFFGKFVHPWLQINILTRNRLWNKTFRYDVHAYLRSICVVKITFCRDFFEIFIMGFPRLYAKYTRKSLWNVVKPPQEEISYNTVFFDR